MTQRLVAQDEIGPSGQAPGVPLEGGAGRQVVATASSGSR